MQLHEGGVPFYPQNWKTEIKINKRPSRPFLSFYEA